MSSKGPAGESGEIPPPDDDEPSRQSLEDSHALLELARQGDGSALGQLTERLRPYLKQVVRPGLAAGAAVAHEDASDLVQQTLMRAVSNLGEFRGTTIQEWRGWLAAIARNETRAALRHQAAEMRDSVRSVPLESGILAADGESPSTAMQRNELQQRLDLTLQELAPAQRQIIRWRQDEQLSHAEIADRLGIRVDAARQRCKAAMDALRKAWLDR